MLRLAGSRLLIFVGSLVAASVLIFLACNLLPGDAAQVMLGVNATPDEVARLRAELGLDRPLPVQYGDWIWQLLQGNFGTSYLTRTQVSDQLAVAAPVSAWLVLLSMIIAVAAAVGMGLVAALWNGKAAGFVVSGLSQLGIAIPAFWGAILLVLVFAVGLRWVPANGYVPLTTDPALWFAHLILPVLSLALVQAAVLTRYLRSAFLEVLSEDYYRTARAIGWSRLGALLRHGLRNAALSVITVIGLQLGALLVGAVVIESVYVLPGLGSLLLTAVGQRDLVVVQSVVLLLVVTVMIINLLVDLSYLLIDPRLRSQTGAGR